LGLIVFNTETKCIEMWNGVFWEKICPTTPWIQKANFPGNGRTFAVGFSIGQKGYVGTGMGCHPSRGCTEQIFYNDFWEYDPFNDTWTQKATFPGKERAGAIGFSIGTKGYVGLGWGDREYYSDFWEYDPSTNIWIPKASFPGSKRFAPVSFSIGSKGYVGTGIYYGYLDDFWEYDPSTNTWTPKANVPGLPRYYAMSFSIGGKGYIGGGVGAEGGFAYYLDDFYEYNPLTDTWIRKAHLPYHAWHATSFSIGTKGYMGLGVDSSQTFRRDLWEYNPSTNSWTRKTDFAGEGRRGTISFSIGQKGYIGTGEDNRGSYKNDFWEYNPDVDQ
jgi:N-acetylneuraminic acid mutarotase